MSAVIAVAPFVRRKSQKRKAADGCGFEKRDYHPVAHIPAVDFGEGDIHKIGERPFGLSLC
jgi:hypothetical protein